MRGEDLTFSGGELGGGELGFWKGDLFLTAWGGTKKKNLWEGGFIYPNRAAV